MSVVDLLAIIAGTSVVSIYLERQVSWVSYITSVCMVIIFAILMRFLGLIPAEHLIYDVAMGDSLDFLIVLMLLTVDLRQIKSLNRSVITIFVVGAMATVVGAVVAGIVATQYHLLATPTASFQTIAQLAASDVGGSENAVTMKKVLGIDHAQFVSVFAMDNILTTVWTVFGMAIVPVSREYARPGETAKPESSLSSEMSIEDALTGSLLSIFVAALAIVIGDLAAHYLGIFHSLIYSSTIGIVFAQIEVLKKYLRYAYLFSAILFYPFFFATGASSDLTTIKSMGAAVLIIPGIMIAVHGVIILVGSRLLRVPRAETVVASQCLIGGPGTALAFVHAKGLKSLIPAALFLGTLGYGIGNYVGVTVFKVMTAIEKRMDEE